MHWIPGKLSALLESLEVAKKFHMLVAVGNSGVGVPWRPDIGLRAIWDLVCDSGIFRL